MKAIKHLFHKSPGNAAEERPSLSSREEFERSKVLDKALTAITSPGSDPKAPRTFAEDNIVAILERRARETPDFVVYTFLDDKGNETSTLTYAQVDAAARQVALMLEKQHKKPFQRGDRVILCYPPGHDFTIAFWGCLYAGAIAVAVYPPHPLQLHKDLPRFNKMVQDTGASLILTNSKYRNLTKLGAVKAFLKKPKRTVGWPEHIAWLKTDKLKIALKSTKATATQPSDVAFIQYTSGSTEEPRPAMVTHANIHAQGLLWDWCASDDLVLGWLPPYHDNGLLAFNLMPIYCGNKSVQMSPLAFIKDPSIWMRMASKYKAGYTCGPNFAYLLAAKRTTDKVAATLDLTKLRNAACGAEPIKPDYLDLFAKKFASAGFVPSQFNCALGMAEATLVVTGYPDPTTRGGPKALTVDRTILEEDHRFEILHDLPYKKDEIERYRKGIHFTGLGYFGRTYDLKIVDPTTRQVLPDGHVGEIWIHGPSMVQNYWNRPELSQTRLQATIPSERDPSKGYFRTNDYGVLVDGELFYVGRIPDMIAMDGRWISPQTIESSVERASDCIRPGCVSCFTLPRHDNEEVRESIFDEDQDPALVVVAELKQDMNTVTTLCKSILRQIWSENHVQATTIVLIQPKSIPKTTSGKLQRWRAKQMFLDKQLKVQCAYSHTVRSVNKKNSAALKEIENALATQRFTPILLLDPASPMPSPIV